MIKIVKIKPPATHPIARHFLPFALLLMVAVISLRPVAAQVVRAEVRLHTDRLPAETKQYINGLDRQLERILNEYNWTEGGRRYELPIRIEIFFDKWTRKGPYYRFTVGGLAAHSDGMQLRDRRYEIRYSRDYLLQVGAGYEPLTGMLEYLVWMCLGFEADRLAPLGGQPYYEKARIVAENARFEMDYYTGWEDRRELVREITGDSLRAVRTAAFHFRAALYYLNRDEWDPARSHIMRAGELMLSGNPKMMTLRREDNVIRFIDAVKMAEAVAKLGMDDLARRLAEWDPDNRDVYLR